MAIKKSQLYSALWDGCDELRGGMDASQYKDYVLVVLFVKYISDKAKKDSDMLISVPEGCSFDDMVALKGKTNIGEEMNKILEKLAEANNLTGVITNADFSDENKLGKGKDLVETVSKLIAVFQREELDFSNNRAADDDLIGDAYEYLMKNFASESGKSKGQFYTPAEVSRIMSKVIGIGKDERQMISIYDPTCGSGSLLLRAKAEAKHNVSIDGQEKDLATIGMARMSMIIHGVDDAELRHGDTLNDPLHKENDTTLQTFDYVVANPPFSMKGWRKSAKEQDIFGRWGFGDNFAPVPPPGCGDYAFLLHIVKSLKTQGHAACILPHGVLFRGGAEAEIRKFLVKKRWISGIIGLPSNLFYGTGIPACIIIIDKEHAAGSKGIFMIDAKEGFQKDGAKNRLREQDIKLIVDTWEAKVDVQNYARFVPYSEIGNEKNNYNLNIPRYVIPKDKEIRQDIYAHLHGGLPAHDVEEVFASLWEACPSLKDRLFRKEANGYYSLVPAADSISEAVNTDASYQKQNALYAKVVEDWCQKVAGDMLSSVKEECEPKSLIERWSGMLLESAKADLKLVDPYNVYEILMNYWAEAMQDDCYMVSRDGWKVALRDTKKKSTFEDLECDLLPVNVVVNKFFAADYACILAKRGEVEQLSGEIEALPEDSPDAFDEGLYEMLDRVNETNVKKALVAQKRHEFDADKEAIKVWNHYVDLCGKKKVASKSLSALIDSLTVKVRDKYENLSAQEIQTLVINNKWLFTIRNRSIDENKRVSESISDDVAVLSGRYAKPLPELEAEIDNLNGIVNGFINTMAENSSYALDYLDSEAGMIPHDWMIKQIGSIGFTYSGLTGKSKNDFGVGDARYVTFLNVLNNPILKTDIFEKVNVTEGERQNRVKRGDLFFNTSSETPEDVGICSMLNEDVPNLYLNSFCFGFRLTDPDVDGLYMSYFFRSKKGRDIMTSLAQGATRYNLSKEAFNKTIIAIPPLAQQKEIVRFLSTSDLLVEKSSEAVSKRALIKQGMMQELLTGKTRLI